MWGPSAPPLSERQERQYRYFFVESAADVWRVKAVLAKHLPLRSAPRSKCGRTQVFQSVFERLKMPVGYKCCTPLHRGNHVRRVLRTRRLLGLRITLGCVRSTSQISPKTVGNHESSCFSQVFFDLDICFKENLDLGKSWRKSRFRQKFESKN